MEALVKSATILVIIFGSTDRLSVRWLLLRTITSWSQKSKYQICRITEDIAKLSPNSNCSPTFGWAKFQFQLIQPPTHYLPDQESIRKPNVSLVIKSRKYRVGLLLVSTKAAAGLPPNLRRNNIRQPTLSLAIYGFLQLKQHHKVHGNTYTPTPHPICPFHHQ